MITFEFKNPTVFRNCFLTVFRTVFTNKRVTGPIVGSAPAASRLGRNKL